MDKMAIRTGEAQHPGPSARIPVRRADDSEAPALAGTPSGVGASPARDSMWSGWPARGVRIGEASHPGPPAAFGACGGCNGRQSVTSSWASRRRCGGCDGPILPHVAALWCSACRLTTCDICAARDEPRRHDAEDAEVAVAGTQLDSAGTQLGPAVSQDGAAVAPFADTQLDDSPDGSLTAAAEVALGLAPALAPVPLDADLLADLGLGPARTAVDPSLTPPVPRAGSFGADGSIGCPFCTRYRTRGSTRGLTRHIYCAHAGRAFDDEAVALLSAIGRGVCSGAACEVFRGFGAGRCYRCHTTQPPRALAVGDRVPSAAAGGIGCVAPLPYRREIEPEIPEGDLPDAFLVRVRQLGSQTIVHIPVAFRSRAAKIMAGTLLSSARGTVRGNALEQARSKLLYGPIPNGFNTCTELEERFTGWEQGRFSELLLRAEAQAAFRVEDRRRRKGGSTGSIRASRAKALTRAGAYRRAVVSLTSEVAELSEAEQRSWTAQLLPCSMRPGSARAAAAAVVDDEAAAAPAASLALDGVRFGALSAAGPTGARPEQSTHRSTDGAGGSSGSC